MSHFMLSQGKFVFAIFACCAYQKHGGRSRQLAFIRKMSKCDIINKVAAILYIKYLVGGGNELFAVKFIDECV